MKTSVWTDPIVAETRKWREELLKEAGNDLGVLTKRLMESQCRHGKRLVDLGSGTARRVGRAREKQDSA